MIKQSLTTSKGILLWLFLPISMLLLVACSKDHDDPGPEPTPSGQSFTLTVVSPVMESEILASSADGAQVNTRFRSHFTKDASKHVFARQNGKIIDIGSFYVTNLSDSGDEGTVEVDTKNMLSAGKPYTLYLVGDYCRSDDENVYFKRPLSRGGSFGTYLKLSSSSIPQKANDLISGTGEILFIINKSGAPIKFKHKGFDAAEKWYYNYAEVSIDNLKVVQSEDGETESEVRNVPVFTGTNASSIYSTYVPNGHKIQDAQLIAEIDGKEVRSTNRISSDIQLQMNHSYAMFAIWDGEKLTLGDGNGEPVVHVCSDEDNIGFSIEDIKDDGTIIVSGNNESMPKVGEIMVSGITEKAPYGFLYRVVDVVRNGGTTIIHTTPATINEAVPNGKYNIKIPAEQLQVDYLIDPFGNRVEPSSTRGDDGATLPLTYKLFWNPYDGKVKNGWLEGWDYKVAIGLDLKGTLGVDMSFIYEAEEGWLDYIGLVGEFSLELEAIAKIVGSLTYEFKDIPITTYWLKPIVVMLGYVPVVFTPAIQVKWKNKLKGKLELSCKLFSTKGKSIYTVGYNRLGDPETGEHFIYDHENEPFDLDDSYTSPSNYVQELSPKLTLSGEWKSTIRTELNISLYGANDYVNLGLALDIFGKLKGQFSLSPFDEEEHHSESLGVILGADFLPVAKLEIKNPIDKDKTYGGKWDDVELNIFEYELFSLFALAPTFDDLKIYGNISQSYKKDAELTASDEVVHIRATMSKPDFQFFPDEEFGFCVGIDDKDEDTRRQTWRFYNLKRMYTDYSQKTNLELDLQTKDFEASTKYYVRPYVKLKNGNYVYRKRGSFTTYGFTDTDGGTIVDVPGVDL